MRTVSTIFNHHQILWGRTREGGGGQGRGEEDKGGGRRTREGGGGQGRGEEDSDKLIDYLDTQNIVKKINQY